MASCLVKGCVSLVVKVTLPHQISVFEQLMLDLEYALCLLVPVGQRVLGVRRGRDAAHTQSANGNRQSLARLVSRLPM